ncbi:MAG: DUF47 domain-containing protein [Candidatus Eiseniibacteriota bacterium]|nr:MAG: DUF47 domain-containing protein [Candidatus Eisenbacteria bacterium]
MLRLKLTPEGNRFYQLIENAGANMAEAARALVELLSETGETAQILEQIRALEHEGDEITHEVMRALSRTFITPLDREDIAGLAQKLDNVVDRIWAAALRLSLYGMSPVTPIARRFGELVLKQTEAIAHALPSLRNRKKMAGLANINVEINRIENEADELLHEGLVQSFARQESVEDVVLGLKWREVYSFLEQATDAGEDVADTLESIVLKYS